jgi:hypothetical protein
MGESKRPPALRFLDEIELDRAVAYSTAPWLESEFEDNVWHGHIGKTKITIDFNILLYNGSNLTSSKNKKLLQFFKHLLCLQTHGDLLGGKILGEATLKRRLNDTLGVIDYFLLNGEQYRLATNGLKLVTGNDITLIFDKVSSTSRICNSLYDWKLHFERFLSTNASNLSISHIDATIANTPMLDNPACADRYRAERNRNARVWLWNNGFYSAPRNKDGVCSLNTNSLCSIFYKNTLRGMHLRPSEAEFTLCNDDVYHREMKQAHVKNFDSIESSRGRMNDIKNIILSLELLETVSNYAPMNLSEHAKQFSRTAHPEKGRYKTLPIAVMFTSLKNAIEFYLQYSKPIFDTITKASVLSKKHSVSIDEIIATHEIIPLKLKSIGVHRWILSSPAPSKSEYSRSKEHFENLRSNISLYSMYKVLMGSICIVIGLLSARRQSELLNLFSDSALDTSHTRLIFRLMKSGTIDLRTRTAIPIPSICTEMIESIMTFQTNICGKSAQIFSKINSQATAFCIATPSSHNELFDIFCDYFETAQESPGKRFYIRQHQLRRGFAMAFFWADAAGGVDTLRRFLGHTDAQHIYNYITESTDGGVFRNIKANFVSGNILQLTDEKNKLSEFLSEKFGVADLMLLDSTEVERYIELQIAKGIMTVEPTFLKGNNGTTYKIIVSVKR